MGTIICKKQNIQEITFTSEGYYMLPVLDDCECVLFPSKDQRDWSRLQGPFKDGDIVATTNGIWIGITKGGEINEFIPMYCVIKDGNEFEAYLDGRESTWSFARFATEEEKQKLFGAIEKNGYKWNAETKTLEKLIQPKFKVGDIIQPKIDNNDKFTITNIDNYFYRDCSKKGEFLIPIEKQDNWEIVPDKFDITTLKPFESKVLVRDKNTDEWRGHFFSHCDNSTMPYNCIGVEGLNDFKQCIPFEGNEHLLGTTDDCSEYYKTWKK
jgi:hypothetical protein